MDTIFQALIDEIRNNKGRQCQTMVDELLQLQKSDPDYYFDEIIRGLIMALVLAATDTSSLTMEWTLSLLLNHPWVLSKAKGEIRQVVGQDHLVKESDLPNLKYLCCIVDEAQRMFPSGPLLSPHQASQDCTIWGYHVSKGTMLLVNAWAIHRSPENWPDPDVFRQERFLGLDLEGPEGYKYKFVPFGVGRRACPGIIRFLYILPGSTPVLLLNS